MMRPRSAVVLVSASLLLAIWMTPWLAGHGWGVAAVALQTFFHAVCHQRPDRSFAFYGQPCAVCVRCLGAYLGLLLGTLLRLASKPAKQIFLAVLLLNVLDVAMEFARLHGSVSWLRFVLGCGLGVSTSAFFLASAKAGKFLQKSGGE